ncbi:MAG: tRNA pseudouridine(38-40) synthase TruA [Acidobacteriota bacterium]
MKAEIHARLRAMATWKLTLEYKGTRYQGWQEQPNARTIQGELRAAAEEFFQDKVDIGGSGRTDAGVHALAQVAHLRSVRKHPAEQVRLSLNDKLPSDIHILSLEPAPERFHARHSATMRSYLYQISKRRTAFAKEFVWWAKPALDLARMHDCAQLFEGRHDFWSFTERPQEQGSTVVVVDQVRIVECGELILVRTVASHFLWKMVRRLVGVMIQVAAGTLEPDRVQSFLVSQSKEVGQWTAPPSGLFLERVLYPGESLPDQIRPAIPVFSSGPETAS